jgi:hypothetical protein
MHTYTAESEAGGVTTSTFRLRVQKYIYRYYGLIAPITLFLQMLLMDAVINHLGPFEAWSTYIFQHLFIDKPSPACTSRLKKVISFLYGNDIPLEQAYAFYIACCGCTGATARFVEEQTTEWYSEWQRSTFRRHMGEYYNMLFKNFFVH